MSRTEIARETVSRKFASRPVRAAVAVKIAFVLVAATAGFAAAKAHSAKSEAPAPIVAASVSTVAPFILPVEDYAEAGSQEIAVASAQ